MKVIIRISSLIANFFSHLMKSSIVFIPRGESSSKFASSFSSVDKLVSVGIVFSGVGLIEDFARARNLLDSFLSDNSGGDQGRVILNGVATLNKSGSHCDLALLGDVLHMLLNSLNWNDFLAVLRLVFDFLNRDVSNV